MAVFLLLVMCAIITGCEWSQINSSLLLILIPESFCNSAICSSPDIVATQKIGESFPSTNFSSEDI